MKKTPIIKCYLCRKGELIVLKQLFWRFVIASMAASFTGMFSIANGNTSTIIAFLIGVPLIFIVVFFFVGKMNLKEELKTYKQLKTSKKAIIIISTLLSTFVFIRGFSFTLEQLLMDLIVMKLIPDQYVQIIYILLLMVSCLICLFNSFIIWYLISKFFLDSLVDFFKQFNKFENCILYTFLLVFTCINFLILLKTNAFVYPTKDDQIVVNVIFTADSSQLLAVNRLDAFSSPNAGQNDIRHLLFGIIGIPFSMVFLPMSYILYFILKVSGFNIYFSAIYGYFLTIGQAFLFSTSAVLLYRMLLKEINESFAKLFSILFLVSFSTILFTMVVEQYAIALFTLILFVYYFVTKNDSKFPFIFSGLSLTTSFAMFPFVILEQKKTKSYKKVIQNVWYIIILTLLLIIYFGQLYEFFSGRQYFKFTYHSLLIMRQ